MDSELLPVIGVAVAGVAVLAVLTYRSTHKLKRAQDEYQSSLDNLERDPFNQTAHQNTLVAGRRLADLARGSTGVTIYDESRIANDIRAVTANATKTAPAPVAPAQQNSTSTHAPTVEQRLQKLNELHANGLLAPDEFETKRWQIFDEL